MVALPPGGSHYTALDASGVAVAVAGDASPHGFVRAWSEAHHLEEGALDARAVTGAALGVPRADGRSRRRAFRRGDRPGRVAHPEPNKHHRDVRGRVDSDPLNPLRYGVLAREWFGC